MRYVIDRGCGLQGFRATWKIDSSLNDDTNGWGTCELSCGTSVKRRKVVCVRSDGVIVDDGFCILEEKPSDTYPCTNFELCTYGWQKSAWTDCEAGCGLSLSTRAVQCLRIELDQAVDETFCGTDPKPVTSKTCTDYSLCKYDWVPLTEFEGCAAVCGSGTESREVQCVRSHPDGNTDYAPNMVEVDDPAVGSWGGSCTCPDGSVYQVGDKIDGCASLACEGGVSGTCHSHDGVWSKRKVTCGQSIPDKEITKVIDGHQLEALQTDVGKMINVTLEVLPEANCRKVDKPDAERECWLFHDCDYQWIAYEWSECDATCGTKAVKTRQVECMRGNTEEQDDSDADTVNAEVDKSFCEGDMPKVQDYCDNDHLCSYAWKEGDWQDCPDGCGEEDEIRGITCERADGEQVHSNYCDGSGWSLVAQEKATDPQQLAFLSRPFGVKTTDGTFNLGPTLIFPEDYDEVLITYGAQFYQFKPTSSIFDDSSALSMELLSFETNDNRMAGWVEESGSAVFCQASVIGAQGRAIELSGDNEGDATNLKACTGECDKDSQCAAGLKCFQRQNGEAIPGCTGLGGGKKWDYCYDPTASTDAMSCVNSGEEGCCVATVRRSEQRGPGLGRQLVRDDRRVGLVPAGGARQLADSCVRRRVWPLRRRS